MMKKIFWRLCTRLPSTALARDWSSFFECSWNNFWFEYSFFPPKSFFFQFLSKRPSVAQKPRVIFCLHLMGHRTGQSYPVLSTHAGIIRRCSWKFSLSLSFSAWGGQGIRNRMAIRFNAQRPHWASDSTRPVYVSLPRPVGFEHSGADAARGE